MGNAPTWLPQGNSVIPEATSTGWTAMTLFKSGCQVSKGRDKPKPIGTRTLKNVVPYVGTKSVLLQTLITGISVPWMVYQVDLMFNDVVFTHNEEETNDREWVEIRHGDLQVYMKKIDLGKNRIKVRCGCADFYFTFGYADFTKKALFGSKPRRYVRKTIYNPTAPVGQRGYPPRNPQLLVGGCKHVFGAIQLAQQNGWILPYPKIF